MEGDLDPAKFAGKEGRPNVQDTSRIRVVLMPDTDADSDTLDKWLEVVEQRCPVSDNLANQTPVLISVAK